MITTLARLVLGVFLLIAGVGHFINLQEFTAQVPPWMPAPEFVVYASGVVEIALGLALIIVRKQRAIVGWIVAAFFVIVFPASSGFRNQINVFDDHYFGRSSFYFWFYLYGNFLIAYFCYRYCGQGFNNFRSNHRLYCLHCNQYWSGFYHFFGFFYRSNDFVAGFCRNFFNLRLGIENFFNLLDLVCFVNHK